MAGLKSITFYSFSVSKRDKNESIGNTKINYKECGKGSQGEEVLVLSLRAIPMSLKDLLESEGAAIPIFRMDLSLRLARLRAVTHFGVQARRYGSSQ